MHGDVAVGDARQLLHVATQVLRAECAVEADAEGARVLHGMPEGFRRLAGEGASRRVGDRAGDHHGHALVARREDFLDGEDRGFRVQRVEDRLDEDDVGAAIEEAMRRFGVGGDEFIERDVAHPGVIDVGRDRGRAVGGPEHASDPAGASVLGFGFVADASGEARAFDVQLAHQLFHPVVGHRDAGGVEGARFNEIRARLDVGAVDVGDDLWLREDEQVVVAAQVSMPVGKAGAAVIGLGQAVLLHHRAHRAVDDEEARGGF